MTRQTNLSSVVYVKIRDSVNVALSSFSLSFSVPPLVFLSSPCQLPFQLLPSPISSHRTLICSPLISRLHPHPALASPPPSSSRLNDVDLPLCQPHPSFPSHLPFFFYSPYMQSLLLSYCAHFASSMLTPDPELDSSLSVQPFYLI